MHLFGYYKKWNCWKTLPLLHLRILLRTPLLSKKIVVVCLILGASKQSNSDTSMMLYKTKVIHQLGAYFLALTQGHRPWSSPAMISSELCQKIVTMLFITIIPVRSNFPSVSHSQSYPKIVCCFYPLYHIKSIASYWKKLLWPIGRAKGTVVWEIAKGYKTLRVQKRAYNQGKTKKCGCQYTFFLIPFENELKSIAKIMPGFYIDEFLNW